MTPEDLRELLAVLREAGATSSSFHPDGTLRDVVLGPMQSVEVGISPPAPVDEEDDDLPPGAYDPIKRRKARGGAPKPDEDEDS